MKKNTPAKTATPRKGNRGKLTAYYGLHMPDDLKAKVMRKGPVWARKALEDAP